MAHVSLNDCQAWLEGTKANLTELDVALEAQIATETLGQLAATYNDPGFGVPTWTDQNTTPDIVKQVIAMRYAGWFYDRQYSEVLASEGNSYGLILRTNADTLITGIINGSIQIVEIQPNVPTIAPVFYPTDASSTQNAQDINTDSDDQSLGPAAFGTAKIF